MLATRSSTWSINPWPTIRLKRRFTSTFAKRGVAGRVMRSREPALVPNVRADPDYFASEPGVESLICVPLVSGDELLGLLNVESGTGRELVAADVTSVRLVADRLAAALALARRRDEIAMRAGVLHEQLIRSATQDLLTGLGNRRFLEAELDRVAAARDRQPFELRQPLSASMFDLDHFGGVNTAHGHPAGDMALRVFADILAQRVRANDIVARYGGEEFVVILDGAQLEGAHTLAEDVRATLAAWVITSPEGTRIPLTVSGGVAELAPGVADPRAAIQAADQALLAAKRQGRNRVGRKGISSETATVFERDAALVGSLGPRTPG